MLPGLDDALQVIDEAGEAWSVQHPAPAEDAPAEERDAYEAAADAHGAQEQTVEDQLRRRYRAAFEAYAEAFTAAALDEARELTGLSCRSRSKPGEWTRSTPSSRRSPRRVPPARRPSTPRRPDVPTCA